MNPLQIHIITILIALAVPLLSATDSARVIIPGPEVSNGDSVGTEAKRFMEFRASSGYGIGKGGSSISSFDYRSPHNSPNVSYSNTQTHYFTAGKGFKIAAKGIRYFTDQIGIFAQFEYSSGSMSAIQNNNIFDPSSNTMFTFTNDLKIKFSYFAWTAGVHFSAHEGMFQPFAGAGAGVYIPREFAQMENINFSFPSIQPSGRNVVLTSNRPIGFTGYFGTTFVLTPKARIFAELKTTLVSFYILREEITWLVVEGVDRLSSLKEFERVTEYKENHDVIVPPAPVEGEPSFGGAPKPFPGNSVSFSIGLSIVL